MRFSWQLTTGIFLLGAGLILGRKSPAATFQAILLIAALCYIARIPFLASIPLFSCKMEKPRNFTRWLRYAVGSRKFLRYSLYLFT